MNRRQFLIGICSIPLVATLPSLGQIQDKTESPSIEKRVDMDSFIQEISKYDLIHFGEEHSSPNSETTETTTLEDFVDFILPKLRGEKPGNKPHELLRTEYLPYETENGKRFIPQAELDALDKTGILTPDSTPTIFREVSHYKDPKGSIKLAKEAVRNGFKVRGLSIPSDKSELYKMVARAERKDFSPEEIERVSLLMMALETTKNYLAMLRSDMNSGRRVVIYGGALHNDNSDLLQCGIADEMHKEFPGRYVSIDLVKPSVSKTDTPYFARYFEILRATGVSSENEPDKITIVKMKNSSLANYIVFLPKRQNKNP